MTDEQSGTKHLLVNLPLYVMDIFHNILSVMKQPTYERTPEY